jgi:hypothetical protein
MFKGGMIGSSCVSALRKVPGFITGFSHDVAERVLFPAGVIVKECPPAEHHVTARIADCSARGTHAVGIAKNKTSLDEVIDMRCFRDGVSQCSDRVGPLVIGKKKQNIRLRLGDGRSLQKRD